MSDYKLSVFYMLLRKYGKEIIQAKHLRNVNSFVGEMNSNDISTIYNSIILGVSNYIKSIEDKRRIGYFSNKSKETTLYTYVYYVMICGLLGKVINDCDEIKKRILNSQCEDGLFYDEKLMNIQYLKGEGWGARHLMPHIIIALERLRCVPNYDIKYLAPFHSYKMTYDIMNSLDMEHIWVTSNYVMNTGVMLQYERDILNGKNANEGVNAIENFLMNNMRNSDSMWFCKNKSNIPQNYEVVRGAYHLFPILLYDNITIPNPENVIDRILSLQNKYGGFDYRKNSSACEDIDAIEPLIRFSIITNGYRKNEVESVLKKALIWIASNQMQDGGFVFRKGENFNYGHENISSGINESNMFATWFRLLCVCYIYDYLTCTKGRYVRVPGYEYPLWGEEGANEKKQ